MTNTQEPAERANALLAALGSTADEIAASLAAANVTGWPCAGDSCAIVAYLRQNGVPAVWADPEQDDAGRLGFGFVGFSGALPYLMTPPVQEFAMRFDREEYPALVGDPYANAIPAPRLPSERS